MNSIREPHIMKVIILMLDWRNRICVCVVGVEKVMVCHDSSI